MMAAIALGVATALVAIVALAAHRAKHGSRPVAIVAIALGSWLALTAILAGAGAVALDGGPPRLLALPVIAIAAAVLASRTRTGRALIAAAPPATVMALEVFRLPVELVLWRLAATGRFATELTFEGHNFDVLVGVTAIPVAILAWCGAQRRPRLALAWHVTGLLLLANIVAMAMLSAPGPQHALDLAPPTTIVSDVAYVWL